MKKKPKPLPPPDFPRTYETFRRIGRYNDQIESEPSCFNGFVSIRRYRITLEEIEEPVEVLAERLRKLWRKSDNHHDARPLEAAASSLGITLDHKEYGKERARRYER